MYIPKLIFKTPAYTLGKYWPLCYVAAALLPSKMCEDETGTWGASWKAFRDYCGHMDSQLKLKGFRLRLLSFARMQEKEMASHSSILAQRIPRTEEPGGQPSMGCTESDTTEATQQQQQRQVEAPSFIQRQKDGSKEEGCQNQKAVRTSRGLLADLFPRPDLY